MTTVSYRFWSKTRVLTLAMTCITASALFITLWPENTVHAGGGCCDNGSVVAVGGTSCSSGAPMVCIVGSPNADPCNGGVDGGTWALTEEQVCN